MGLMAWAWPRALRVHCSAVVSWWRPDHGHGFRLLTLGLLIITPVALPALAYATLPDPLWIPGIYDDADYDDVVTLVTSAAGDIAP